jgi:hypothetical protein
MPIALLTSICTARISIVEPCVDLGGEELDDEVAKLILGSLTFCIHVTVIDL